MTDDREPEVDRELCDRLLKVCGDPAETAEIVDPYVRDLAMKMSSLAMTMAAAHPMALKATREKDREMARAVVVQMMSLPIVIAVTSFLKNSPGGDMDTTYIKLCNMLRDLLVNCTPSRANKLREQIEAAGRVLN